MLRSGKDRIKAALLNGKRKTSMIRKFDSATPLVVHALTKCLCTTHAITVESMCASIIIDLYKQSTMIMNDLAMSRPLPPSLPHKFKSDTALKYLDTVLRNTFAVIERYASKIACNCSAAKPCWKCQELHSVFNYSEAVLPSYPCLSAGDRAGQESIL